MSGRTLATVGAGALVGAAIFFSGGTALAALQGFALGATAAALVLGPETPQGDMRPDELKMTNSTEAATIPVIFGTSRLAGNHIGYDRDTFRTVEIEAEGGKGGGSSQVAGYKYFLSWATGLCMGEVDELVKVQGSPGEENVLWKERRTKKNGTYDFDSGAGTITGNTNAFRGIDAGDEVVITGSITPENDGRFTVLSIDVLNSILTLTEGVDTTETSTVRLSGYTVQDPIDLSSGPVNLTFDGDREDGGSCTIFSGTD
jgi:hypothetical protein